MSVTKKSEDQYSLLRISLNKTAKIFEKRWYVYSYFLFFNWFILIFKRNVIWKTVISALKNSENRLNKPVDYGLFKKKERERDNAVNSLNLRASRKRRKG